MAARMPYLAAIRLGCREFGGDPSTEVDAPRIWFRADRALAPDDARPYIDVLGRSTGPERKPLSAEELIEEGARHLKIDVADLASRTRQRHVVEARRLLLTLGRERMSQRARDLSAALGKKADTISYLAREGIRRRLENDDFAKRYEALDEAMIDDVR